MDSSSSDSNSCTIPSPSSAATSFELPSKEAQLQPANPEPSNGQSSTSSNPPLSFLSLPSDIHHLILTDYLPYDSIVALRSTSSHFHSLIPPTTLKRLRRNVISQLLAEERGVLKRWLPQLYGRYSGRPTTHMTCYSCLQSVPITDFFASQVHQSRGLGRKRAAERWCKPCGLKYGKIRHGRWMYEVSYGIDDQLRYEAVMGGELKVSNPCVTCPPKHRYDGQQVWWGCVDCFEKEEKRLQKQDSERRRDLRRHCSKVKHGVKAFVEPENLRELGQEVRWSMRTRLGWSGLMRRGYSIYWWVRDENPVTRMCRTCRRIGGWLDPRQMKEPGERLGRKAKSAVVSVLELAKKKKNEKANGRNGEGVDPDIPTVSAQDCILCNTIDLDPTLEDFNALRSAIQASTSHDNQHTHTHTHTHIHFPTPCREVRCWRCWRAKRSRRRRRYDDGLAYGLPLPQDRWCDGC